MKHNFQLIGLHDSKSARELAQRSFDLFGQAVTHLAFFLTLRPGEFELPSFSSEPSMQKYFDIYISGGHKYDIWMRRGAISPNVRAIRHSDHTPLHVLKRSLFYKKIIGITGCSYGASVMAWRGNVWLATLTAFRTFKQGDFSDADMEQLFDLQPHFESTVKRVAELHEAKLGNDSLQVFIWSLPSAAIVLSWDFKIIHHNAAAQDLCRLWRFGPKGRKLKNEARLQVPGDIIARLKKAKDGIPEVSPTRYNRPKIFSVINLTHREVSGLTATVSFLPSKTLAITRGTFLVTMEHRLANVQESATHDITLSKLSRREREIAQLAAQGLNAPEIAKRMGTQSATVRQQLHFIYRKLKIKSRYQLLTLLQVPKNTLADK